MDPHVDVLVVTATKPELEAVLAVEEGRLGEWTLVDADIPYRVAQFKGRDDEVLVATAHLPLGNAGLSIAKNLVSQLMPRTIGVCGLCVGNEALTSLGDIVIADKIQPFRGDTITAIKSPAPAITVMNDSVAAIAREMVGPAEGLPGYADPSDEEAEWWLLEQLFYKQDPLKTLEFPRYFPGDQRARRFSHMRDVSGTIYTYGAELNLTPKGSQAIEEHIIFRNSASNAPYHIHIGRICSLPSLSITPKLWGVLKTGDRTVLAYETSGSSMAVTVGSPEISSLVVRGVVDLANHRLNGDRYHRVASRAAAEVLMRLVRRTVRPARRTKLTRRPANEAALLREVHIRSFKSLEDVRVELGLVNVFIGANGSGKSNLLEAIGLLGAAASGRVDDEGLLRRGVRPGLPRLYLSSFLESAEPQTIHLSACTGNATYDVELLQPEPSPSWHYGSELLTAGEQEILRRTNNGSQARNPTAGLAALELVELEPESPAASLLTSLREYAIHAPNTVTLRGLVSDPQTRAPLGLAGGRLAEALDELQDFARQDSATEEVIDDLRELIDWVADFGARRGGDVPLSPSIPRQQQVLYFRDRFMAAGRNELSAYDASEGALYVLFAMIAATHPSSPPLLAIDNVD
ncbi:MAG: AAA family ATPase, partial [Myxococcales bacterium]|nr:AAA family ATPase [Myxococcales bacterium]